MAVAKCLSCGELLRRHPDSDRKCPKCRGHFFAWDARETDTWIGEDYSLPASWYGDLTGVSAHYIAIENVKNEPDQTAYQAPERSGRVLRVVPTGPDGTMRYLTTTYAVIPRKTAKKPIVKTIRPATDGDRTAYYTGESAHMALQRIEA
jgi:hypothetical protein